MSCRCPAKSKTSRIPFGVKKVGGQRRRSILPGEEPPDLGRCPRKDMDGLSPKRSNDVAAMDRGFSDEAIVVVKPVADENTVTYLRIKLQESDREVGDEGRNVLAKQG